MNEAHTDYYRRVYGLTGIIGSGKSTAAQMFRQRGAVVIDADGLVHDLYSRSNPDYENVKETLDNAFKTELAKLYQAEPSLFSARVNGKPGLDSANGIDRTILGKIVFSDTAKLAELEKLIHPLVQAAFAKIVSENDKNKQLILYDVPLLFEKKLHLQMLGSILVYVPEEIAIERAIKRGNTDRATVLKRLAAQISIEKKRELADYILDNSGNLAQLQDQVDKLYDRLLADSR